MRLHDSVTVVKPKEYWNEKDYKNVEFNNYFQFQHQSGMTQLSVDIFVFPLLIFTCGKFHTQKNKMIYLAPGDNHIPLEIEN